MTVTSIIDVKKERLRKVAKVMCGACKATGLKHIWNDQGDFLPVDPPRVCPYCNGKGQRE